MGNTLNYVNYDFDDNMQQLIDRLKAASGAWKDTNRSGTGQMLIELFAYIANQVLYYIERRAEESYLPTAKLRSSVINLVRLLNYIPRRQTSAIGILTFTLSSPATKNIYLPQWLECQTAAGIKYLVSEDAVILTGESSKNANAMQGEKVDIEITADGTLGYEYNINDINVENTALYIYVDGGLWTKVSSFLGAEPIDKYYLIKTELDDTVTIVFGDNIKGKAPDAGSIILIRYVKSDGINGNVYLPGKIITIIDNIYDEDGGVVSGITVTNADTFLGGDSAQDIEDIRTLAPAVFSTGSRAVTKADYISILKNYPGVADANVWGEAEETPPDITLFNVVRLVILLQEWALPGSTFKTALTTYLYDYAQITVKYEFIDAEILNVIPTLDIVTVEGSTLAVVQDRVETALTAQFVLGTTAKLGISKYLSDLMYVVDDCEGVSYHHMILEIYKALGTGYDSFYDFGILLEAVPILAGSVRVFVNDVQVAIDDGAGHFTDMSSSLAVSGEVNYVTGYIGIDVVPALGPSDVVSVRYQMDEDGDIIVTKKQVTKLYDVDVTSIS